MNIGDPIQAYPSEYRANGEIKGDKKVILRPQPPREARVEYIHPRRRYITVRFTYAFGSFCESFPYPKGQKL